MKAYFIHYILSTYTIGLRLCVSDITTNLTNPSFLASNPEIQIYEMINLIIDHSNRKTQFHGFKSIMLALLKLG